MDVRTAVFNELDRIRSEGAAIPSLRVLRARIGRGSLTTISDAVKEWELRHVPAAQPLPDTLPSEWKDAVANAVWHALHPFIRETEESAHKEETAKAAAEMTAAKELRREAEGMLAEAEAQKAEIARLTERLQEQEVRLLKLTAALNAAQKDVKDLNQELISARRERDAEHEDMLRQKAALQALKDLLPILKAVEKKD